MINFFGEWRTLHDIVSGTSSGGSGAVAAPGSAAPAVPGSTRVKLDWNTIFAPVRNLDVTATGRGMTPPGEAGKNYVDPISADARSFMARVPDLLQPVFESAEPGSPLLEQVKGMSALETALYDTPQFKALTAFEQRSIQETLKSKLMEPVKEWTMQANAVGPPQQLKGVIDPVSGKAKMVPAGVERPDIKDAPSAPPAPPADNMSPAERVTLAAQVKTAVQGFQQRLATDAGDAEARVGLNSLSTMIQAHRQEQTPFSKLVADVNAEVPEAAASVAGPAASEINMAAAQLALNPDAAVDPKVRSAAEKQLAGIKAQSGKLADGSVAVLKAVTAQYTPEQLANPRMAAAVSGAETLTEMLRGATTESERQMLQFALRAQTDQIGLMHAQLKSEKNPDGLGFVNGYGEHAGYDWTAMLGLAGFGLTTYQILVQNPKESKKQRDFALDMYRMQRDDNREDMRLQYELAGQLKGTESGGTKSSAKISSSRYKVRL